MSDAGHCAQGRLALTQIKAKTTRVNLLGNIAESLEDTSTGPARELSRCLQILSVVDHQLARHTDRQRLARMRIDHLELSGREQWLSIERHGPDFCQNATTANANADRCVFLGGDASKAALTRCAFGCDHASQFRRLRRFAGEGGGKSMPGGGRQECDGNLFALQPVHENGRRSAK